MQPEERERVRPEEAGYAVRQRRPVGQASPDPWQGGPDVEVGALLDRRPEGLQLGDPVLRLIAGDEAGIDRTDRGADDPVGLDAGLMQRLVDAGLVGAERSAALQDQ